MKKLITALLIFLFTPTLAFALSLNVATNFGSGNIGTLDQWVSTTSPSDSITQRTTNKRIQITGLTNGSNLCLDANGFLTTTGCTGGAGGSSGGTWSTTTSSVLNQLINYSNNNTDIVTVGGTATTSAKFYFDPNIKLGQIQDRLKIGNNFIATTTTVCAYGCDYSDIDTAVDTVAASTTILIKNGTYALGSNTITVVGGKTLDIIGESKEGVVITYSGGGSAFTIGDSSNVTRNFRMENITIRGTSSGTRGFSFVNVRNSTFNNLYAYGFTSSGNPGQAFRLDGTGGYTGDNEFYNLRCDTSDYCVNLAGTSVNANHFYGFTLRGTTRSISLTNTNGNSFEGGLVGSPAGTGILLTGTGDENYFDGIYCESDLTCVNLQAGASDNTIHLLNVETTTTVVTDNGSRNNVSFTGSDFAQTYFNGGNFGIGTTSPYAPLSVLGQIVGSYFTATTTTASIFPYASTTAISATTICLTGDTCRTTWPTGGTGSVGNWFFGTTNFGVVASATTTPIWAQAGIQASTTSYFDYSSTTVATIPTAYITKLRNLTSNGFVKTSGADGTLSVDTSTYITGNQTVTLSGDITGTGATAITTSYNGVVPVNKGGTNATSFTTTGNDVYWDGTRLATAPLTSAITIPYASTTALSATTICLTGDICRTTWPTGSGSSSVGPINILQASDGAGGFIATGTPQLTVGNLLATSTTATSTFAGELAQYSGTRGFSFFNNAQPAVDAELVRMFWSGNVFNINAQASGAGTVRGVSLQGNNTTLGIGSETSFNQSVSIRRDSTTASHLFAILSSNLNTAAGFQNAETIATRVTQTGTGGFRGLFISPLITSVGSQGAYLIDAGTNSAVNAGGTHTPKFTVNDSGTASSTGVFKSASTTDSSVFPYASSTALSATTLCLTGDLPCRTTWPVGFTGPYPAWSTTTSQVSGQAIVKPNNTTDIVVVGGTSTSTALFSVNPNLGTVKIGTALNQQPLPFGSAFTPFQIDGSINDGVGLNIFNTNTGTQAVSYIALNNNNTTRDVPGALAKYTANWVFGGGNWDGVPLGFGSLKKNDSALYVTDGNLIFGAATSSASHNVGNVQIFTGFAGSFSSGIPDFVFSDLGYLGIGTTTPAYPLSVVGFGGVVADIFTATSTRKSTFPYASTTAISASSAIYSTSQGVAAGAFAAFDPSGKLIATSSPSGTGTVTTLTAGTNITFSSGATCTSTCTINASGGSGTFSFTSGNAMGQVSNSTSTLMQFTAFPYSIAASSSAIVDGNLVLGLGAFNFASSTASTTISHLDAGNIVFPYDMGKINGLDFTQISAPANSEQSYSFNANGSSTPNMTIFSRADGSGGIFDQKVGIGSTTPWGTLSVVSLYTSTTTIIHGDATHPSCDQYYSPNGTAYRTYMSNAGSMTTEAGNCQSLK